MQTLRKQLSDALSDVRMPSCFCGFDGFVDEVVHVVDQRIDGQRYSRVMTLTDYGRRIAAGSGLSINVEIVTVDKKLGGNGPIFANGLKRIGASVVYIGSVGRETVDPVFASLQEGSTVIGLADPGRTDAMEFTDGKIIRSKLESLGDVSWQTVLDRVGVEAFAAYMDDSELISFNNWTMLPHMTALWDGILGEAIPRMRSSRRRDKTMFFDLADPEKRTQEDIRGALARLKAFRDAGFTVILGLNRKEACEISGVLGRPVSDYHAEPLETLTRYLFDALALDCIVVHPVDRAACMTADGYFEAEGPYCAVPRLTTGAGDNFNAGFIFGCLQGYAPEACLTLGTAVSGYYVRACHSPDVAQIREFLDDWDNGRLQ